MSSTPLQHFHVFIDFSNGRAWNLTGYPFKRMLLQQELAGGFYVGGWEMLLSVFALTRAQTFSILRTSFLGAQERLKKPDTQKLPENEWKTSTTNWTPSFTTGKQEQRKGMESKPKGTARGLEHQGLDSRPCF